MLIDLSDRSYTGKDADAALSEAHITTNKNTVPNDPRCWITAAMARALASTWRW